MRKKEQPAPPTFAEEWAPRERASQEAAARKRTREGEPTPEPPARFSLPLDKVLPIGGGLVVAFILAFAIGRQPSAPLVLPAATPTLRPTSAPVHATATPEPTVQPSPTSITVVEPPLPQSGQGLTIEQPGPQEVAPVAPAPASEPTIAAIGEWIGATSTATYATAASLGVPQGVIPWTPTPKARQ